MHNIKAVLLDAERQQQQNEKLRLCMWKLRDIFYDAEDVIDDFYCEALRNPNHHNNEKVRFLASCCFPFSFSLNMGHKIKEINKRLNKLATEWNSFNLGQYTNIRHVFHRQTHSFVHSSDVIGRDADKENIIDLLMKPSEDWNIPVIPIVGIGGLGKTTLTQLVYNDYRVTRFFPFKIWICVSDEFDLPRLLKLIIQSLSKGEKCDDLSVEALQTCLRNLLHDEKFLLVLDDVWNENRVKWIEFRDLFRSMGGLSESKIIVTTRSLKVASIMSSTCPYELKGLPHEDCLILFTKWAFNDGDESRHPNLMRIGEEIVKKCKGVPLAVRTLGSLLFSKTDASEWISIRDSEIWRLEQSENDILPVLKLSYNHLPSHLQRCLAFLSLYKKDEIYNSNEVIQFWMANDLLEHPKQKQEWEDVGDRYLNELQSRCLIQKEKDYGMYCTFKMHDLIHDLTLDVSQKECKTVNSQTELVDRNVRHLSFTDEKLLKVPHLKKLKNVRTVIVREVLEESLRHLCVSKFKYLRVLRLRDSHLTVLPNSIGTLKHLRDLDLTNCRNIKELPSSFDQLRCLQTLRMRGVPLMQLPCNMESLIELRYLEITIKASHLKEIGPGCWTSLHTWPFMNVTIRMFI
ncbi:Leucine-rich repeat containing protein isoform 2 [Hibiscus syriacus]|uniref:Leucine-rich repeat containing protein isoform 2 n=1 Tax=Hibiscus syriacus TaxID=106335 RepID=A0A6A2XSJ9_HIBSY|nr:putative disease resistance protein RGA1 [Hibiscus syriacus]KAE8678593.1 Leucine-rich repeat containing protein isoform 2 [Hibiscus syriacus]